MLMYYNEVEGPLEVESFILDLVGSGQFMSVPKGHAIVLKIAPCPLPSYFSLTINTLSAHTLTEM